MWPPIGRLAAWRAVLGHPAATICWLQVIAHPLFRRAVRGHWCLGEARRFRVAEHLAELARHNAVERPTPEFLAYQASLAGSAAVWWFRIENDLVNGKPSAAGLNQAIKGELYEFAFDAASLRLLWASRAEWQGF